MKNLAEIEELELFSQLELIAKQVVEGFLTGLHRSPYHGFSVEFAEHRIYNKGESTKHIDWKLFARTEKLFVKKYEEETNLRGQVVLDCSSSMLFPFKEKSFKDSCIIFSLRFIMLFPNRFPKKTDRSVSLLTTYPYFVKYGIEMYRNFYNYLEIWGFL